MFVPDEGPSEFDFRAPTLGEQHAQWHQVHGRDVVCPLDCGIGEIDAYYDAPPPGLDEPCQACDADAGEACEHLAGAAVGT